MLVFVPLSETELAGWARVGSYAPKSAYGVTPSLREAFGFTAADDEDAEHTALHIAGLHGLLDLGTRLVAVAEASARPVQDDEFGEVHVDDLPWGAVTALFSEDVPDAAEALQQRLGGLSVASAWDNDEVADFLAEHELLWHGPGEWDSLVG